MYIGDLYNTLGRKKVLTSVLDSLLLHSWLQLGTKICNKNPIVHTSVVPLKLLHVYYKHATYVLHTN